MSGDIFALVAGYAGLDVRTEFPKVLELAAQIAGITTEMDPEMRRRLDARRDAERVRLERESAERAAARARMPAVWESLDRRSLVGERYLIGRGIDPRALRDHGDLVRFSPSGEPAVPLRGLETGAIVGLQYRCLEGDRKLRAERGSQLAGSALSGRVAELDRNGVDVLAIVEGLADTLVAQLAFPGCAVFGAPGAEQMSRIAAALAPHVLAVHGWLLLVVDDDETGVANAAKAINAAESAGLGLADADAGLDGPPSVRLVEIGQHHDLADAWAAGWRFEWPRSNRDYCS